MQCIIVINIKTQQMKRVQVYKKQNTLQTHTLQQVFQNEICKQ